MSVKEGTASLPGRSDHLAVMFWKGGVGLLLISAQCPRQALGVPVTLLGLGGG